MTKPKQLKKFLKKWWIRAIVAIVVIVVALAIYIYQQNTKIIGDVNSDNVITLKDCEMIKKHLLGKTKLNYFQAKRADVNSDGTVDIVDYSLIRLHVFSIQPLQ